MHIPDGFLTVNIWLPMWILTILILGYAVAKTNKKLAEKNVPMLGVLAAFVFAAQMLNTPVAGGTSGHLLGGMLCAVLLGPLTASIIMACVFIVQGVLYQDGGITALGANIFNMGLIGTIGCYLVYALIRKACGNAGVSYIGAAAGAWLSVVLASAATAAEIAASGVISPWIVIPAMVSIHVVVGLIEAAVTVSVLKFISKTRPDLLGLEKL